MIKLAKIEDFYFKRNYLLLMFLKIQTMKCILKNYGLIYLNLDKMQHNNKRKIQLK